MLKKVYYKTREDGSNLVRVYSDQNFMIKLPDDRWLRCESIEPEDANTPWEETAFKILEPKEEYMKKIMLKSLEREEKRREQRNKDKERTGK